MSKQKAATAGSFVGEIFQFGIYKPSQGRVTRQVTCGAIGVAILLGAYWLHTALHQFDRWDYVVPSLLGLVGCWGAYRLVNYHQFADFLIAVEAEMNKVSWPSRGELLRSATVVIVVIFLLSIALFGFDIFWQVLFKHVLHVLR